MDTRSRGHRRRSAASASYTRRTWGSGPKTNKRIPKRRRFALAAGDRMLITTYEPAREGRSATNLRGSGVSRCSHLRDPIMGLPTTGASPGDGDETSIALRSQGVSGFAAGSDASPRARAAHVDPGGAVAGGSRRLGGFRSASGAGARSMRRRRGPLPRPSASGPDERGSGRARPEPRPRPAGGLVARSRRRRPGR